MTALLRVGLLLLLPALAGCLYYHRWSRPGATEQDFYRDSMQCHRMPPTGWCSGAGWGSGCDDLARAQREAVERCLRAQGWHPVGVVSITGGSDEEYAP
jgi:hypothetical protein